MEVLAGASVSVDIPAMTVQQTEFNRWEQANACSKEMDLAVDDKIILGGAGNGRLAGVSVQRAQGLLL